MMGENFVEIFVATPLEICERRDPKGLYAKARNHGIENFTGVDDVYEPPTAAEITIETEVATAESNARSVMQFLEERGYISVEDQGDEQTAV